jgi:endonuclease I
MARMGSVSFILAASLFVLFFSFRIATAACTKPTNIPSFNSGAYYQPTQGLTGDALKSSLNQLIRGHTRHSYKCVWEILKESDQDPNNQNNLILIYIGRSQPKFRQDSGTGDNDAWNREHIWAKSHGFRQKSQHAYTDAHHLRPSDKTVNSARGNKDFDEGGQAHSECSLCQSTSDTWEPPDTVKGDVARMMFYMVVRYEGGDQSNTPDLELVDHLTDSDQPEFGKLCTLYNWHKADGVSDFERNRNNIVYSWQGNRNPFIDHPEFVKAIWGGQCAGDSEEPDEIEATDNEAIQALINILEKKGIITKQEIADEIIRMRE